MSELNKLPNLGENLTEKLREIGIETAEELIQLGSKETFKRLKAIDDGVCFNTLCALEGAIQGIRWHYLSNSDKNALKEFFRSLK